MPRVSAVIPASNAAAFLADAVLAQTYRDFEVVVVGDGSTDATAAAAARYSEVRYIRQAQAGPSAARNAGIGAARGELIAFLDSDDLWLPRKLELQVPLFDDPRVGFCYGDYREIALDGTVIVSLLAGKPAAPSGYIFESLIDAIVATDAAPSTCATERLGAVSSPPCCRSAGLAASAPRRHRIASRQLPSPPGNPPPATLPAAPGSPPPPLVRCPPVQ